MAHDGAQHCCLVRPGGDKGQGNSVTSGERDLAGVRTRKQFAAEFTTDDLTKNFYEQFRCGILHQAEVGGEGKVWSVGPSLRVEGGAITINRNKFHECLKAEFQTYLSELRDPRNLILRENFRKKMNFVSRT